MKFSSGCGRIGEERALDAVGALSRGNVVGLSQHEAIEAARLSLQYKLAMADSIILATARTFQATLWTQDAHFKEIEGVRYLRRKPENPANRPNSCKGEASAGYTSLLTRAALADASPQRASHYRQVEADEAYYEKPEVTLERLARWSSDGR